jgi:hypothetical protein
MDPVTLLGAVAAAAQLAGTTAKLGLQLYRFYSEVKNAPTKSKELCDEIFELSSVIEKLSDTLKTVEEIGGAVVVGSICSDSLQGYSQFLTDLSSRIQVNKNDTKKRLKWPFSTKDNEELIAKSERYKATLTLALGNVSLKLSSAHTYFLSIYTGITIEPSLNKLAMESGKSRAI